MPLPNPRQPRQQAANLKSHRLIYLSGSDIFRFIENNPYTCVQVVTYKIKEEIFSEIKQEKTIGMVQPKEPHMQAMVREVQYWNCEGFEQGERT
jgi:hypothetical protein